ncbi:MAG: twin-arginine translocase subunit TatB [Alphaproteobacteria bacterium]|nr:MAG: twin-arginine translocase subunit TatB [Alphaproteobacteria bacterium]
MFDISWGKLVIIGVVALIVIGPKELPAVLRTVGQWMGKIRRMASEFQGQFQEAMREAEMADLKKQFDETTSAVKSTFDTTDIKNELEKMIQDPTAAATPPASTSPTTPPSDPTAPPQQTPTTTPTDPVALGTTPVAPAPAVDVSVPMPELPPPPETKDFIDTAAPAPAPAPKPEGDKAA